MSLVVTLEVHAHDGRGRIGLVVVKNIGPTVDVEGEDPGGERRYQVHMSDGLRVTDTIEVTHARRDGALALAAKALSALAAASPGVGPDAGAAVAPGSVSSFPGPGAAPHEQEPRS